MPQRIMTPKKNSRVIINSTIKQHKDTTYNIDRKLSTGTSVSFSKKIPSYIVEGKHLIKYGK